jgi:hypothetical protein
MGEKYYRIFIGELKDRPFQEGDELFNIWYLLVQDQFPDFDMKRYKTEKGANMAIRRIKKCFPDIPLGVEHGS